MTTETTTISGRPNAALPLAGTERIPMDQAGAVVSAGSFAANQTYQIISTGSTNFTLIGATANTVGLIFKATGAGSGNGTAAIMTTVDATAQDIADLGGGNGSGPALSNATPQPLGAASAGNSGEASRGNHRHAMPTAAQVGADPTGTAAAAVAAAAGDYATAAQGVRADTAVQPAALSSGLAGKADVVGGVVPTSQIPAIAISDYLGAVASQAAMLALTGQRGDWCLRTDGLPNTGQWILGGDNAALLSNWVQIPLPTVPVQSVNGQAGVIVLGTGDLAESGGNLFFTGARAIAAALTGFNAGAGIVSAADSILLAIQKIVGNIANLLPRTIETVNTAYSATINIDFAADNGKVLVVSTLTGPLTFTFSNIVQGRNVSVDLLCDSTQRALTFPASTPFLGPKPSSIGASKAATLTFECRRPGTTDADVRAGYGVQQ